MDDKKMPEGKSEAEHRREIGYKSEIREISLENFFQAVLAMRAQDWRLAQICAVCVEGGYEMSYSFCNDRNYWMLTLRLDVKEDQEIASITHIYPCAFIQENEAAELFGVKIRHIEPDYHNTLYRIDETAPFKKKE